MFNRRQLTKTADWVSSNESSSSCSTVTSLSSIPSRFSLLSAPLLQNQSPRRRHALFPSCLSRQDSNPSDSYSSTRRAITPDVCQQPLIHSLESGRSLKLTEDDLELVRSTWEKIPNKLLWCQGLFLKLFSQNEQMKKVMGYDGLSLKELIECRRFEAHCGRFVDFWQRLIDILAGPNQEQDHIDQRAQRLVNKIREVGLLHCQMPGVTFDAESWLLFKNSILESVYLQQCDQREKRHLCWAKFVAFVISEMKDAFHQGVRSRSHTF